jgi:hypothetical protein
VSTPAGLISSLMKTNFSMRMAIEPSAESPRYPDEDETGARGIASCAPSVTTARQRLPSRLVGPRRVCLITCLFIKPDTKQRPCALPLNPERLALKQSRARCVCALGRWRHLEPPGPTTVASRARYVSTRP